MKQTTIQIYIEEAIWGANVFATSRRTKWNQDGNRKPPLPEEEQAWKLIAGQDSQWGIGKWIEPKEGETDSTEWFKALSERIERVCNNRKFKSKVRIVQQTTQGYAIKWSVTFYWDKPKETQHKGTHGVWTLKEYKGTSSRGKVIERFDGILECYGDDLYRRLPDGYVPDGYDIFPDYDVVIVCQSIREEKENPIWWEFEFKRGKQQKQIENQ